MPKAVLTTFGPFSHSEKCHLKKGGGFFPNLVFPSMRLLTFISMVSLNISKMFNFEALHGFTSLVVYTVAVIMRFVPFQEVPVNGQ